MNLSSPNDLRSTWKVPSFETVLWLGKQYDYCVVIPVINEGERIKNLLTKMAALQIDALADIIIVDGGSKDGSLELPLLQQGYEGIVTIDGNDKDDPDAIPRFIAAVKEGIDFVQASRFIPGGAAENTPRSRDFAISFIHAPMLRLFSGFTWTDTTQCFRAYSRRVLIDPRVAPFRDVFATYELLAYLSHRVPRLGYRCMELPTIRRYPRGEVPTKISSVKGNLTVLLVLMRACLNRYAPR